MFKLRYCLVVWVALALSPAWGVTPAEDSVPKNVKPLIPLEKPAPRDRLTEPDSLLDVLKKPKPSEPQSPSIAAQLKVDLRRELFDHCAPCRNPRYGWHALERRTYFSYGSLSPLGCGGGPPRPSRFVPYSRMSHSQIPPIGWAPTLLPFE